ncbi:MAG: cysteine desulfurase NifS [Clostridiales bacterium]|nr:cysteine desulfurase NifS [Clostridiales bacterium]MDD7347466.1 cysteine desulfurase NifS [Clostridiales bacterium]MDY4060676.1 cysteine desulfurase NifS [Anaerovoracaceae bacterium]
MRQVYLDYSATTPVKDEVLQEMIPYFTENYGNPSSLYSGGLNSKAAIDKARKQLADLINADPSEIFFTGSGTEADNWALEGMADAMRKKGKGNHIITTKIEHHAILHTCEYLAAHGFEVTYLGVDSDGRVNPKDLEDAITDKTILISIMLVNNEVGTVQDIREMVGIAKRYKIPFHTDGVQALGNVPIDVKALGVDFLSMSAHKIYGPKGMGALYIRKGMRPTNFIHGGAQEMGRRAGTENLPGIVGFGKAAEIAKRDFDKHVKHSSEVRDYLLERIKDEIPDVEINGTMKQRHPGNLNVTFDFIEGESLLILLDMKGISVSTGSACSSKSLKPSHVLDAMGVPWEKIHGTVRMTVGDFTSKEDVDYVVDELKNIVIRLREISPINEEKGWN